MNTIQTITISPAPHIALQLQLSFRSALTIAVDRLADIAVKYIREQDLLSKRVYAWCCETLEIDFDLESDEIAAGTIGSRITELFHTILINPLTETPYKNPVCVHDWVLEKSMLIHLKEFDGHPITNPDDFPPHQFAQDIIDWVSLLVSSAVIPHPKISQETLLELVLFNRPNQGPNVDTLIGRVPNQGNNQQNRVLQLFYQQMAAKAIAVRNLDLKEKEVENEIVRYEELRRASTELIAREVAASQQALAEHEVMIEQIFLSVERAHQNTTSLLRSQIVQQARQYTAIQATNAQTLNILGTRLTQAINRTYGLGRQLSSASQANQTHQAEIAKLRAIVGKQTDDIESLHRKSKKRTKCVIQ